jgi:site-specific DNA recombinase
MPAPTKPRPSPNGLPYVRYGRVSRVGGREGEGYISPDEQARITLAVAADRGVAVLDEPLFFDENQSGGNLDRRGFQRALELVRQGERGGVIVATFDRFSRDEEDAFAIINEVEALGGRLLCGDGDVSLATSEKALHTGVRVIFSAFERRRKAEGLAAAVARAVGERGVHLYVPFGYRRSDGRSSPLEVYEPEARVVRLMFKRRAEGWSWQAIADEANALAARGEGRYPRPRRRQRGGEPVAAAWSHKSVRGVVVDRPVYLGVAHSGAHEFAGAHPAIVDERTHRLANQARGTKFRRPDGGAEEYLGRGFARCASCGHVMVHSAGSYRCLAKQHGRSERCPAPVTVPADQLEKVILAEFYLRAFSEELGPTADDGAITEADAELDAAERQLEGAMVVGERMGELSASERRVHDRRMDAARARLRRAEAQAKRARVAARAADIPVDLDAERVATMLEDGRVADVRTLISRVIATFVVRRAARWREPVPERVQVFGVDETPAGHEARIAFVRGLDH